MSSLKVRLRDSLSCVVFPRVIFGDLILIKRSKDLSADTGFQSCVRMGAGGSLHSHHC